MRITLGNIDGKAYGLNIYEVCVYAVIEKCSRGNDAKGWFGTHNALANSIPCVKFDRSTVTRAVAKLLNLGLIIKDGEKLIANVQTAPDLVQTAPDLVQTAPDLVQTAPDLVQIALPPITPLYNNKIMKEEKEQPRADMRTRDGANVQPSGSDLINSFYSFRNAWLSAGGVTAEFERRSTSIWVEWMEMPGVKRQVILDNLNKAVMAKRQPEHWKDNPLFFLRDYPEPLPTNYNGKPHPTGEPMVIAKYQGIGGVFTRREALLFNMTDLIDLDV